MSFYSNPLKWTATPHSNSSVIYSFSLEIVSQIRDVATASHSSLYKYADGSWYRGARQGRRRHGQGKLQLATGELYEGDFAYGVRQGKGRMRYP